MANPEYIGRRHCIPIMNTRGSHYQVGYDVGRNFSSVIQSFLETCTYLNEYYLPLYDTARGRKNYDETLEAVNKNFPQYIRELEGTADGAKVPFHKLFILHMDEVILDGTDQNIEHSPIESCSSIIINDRDNQIIGHTEDAHMSTLNHFYFVSAHILSDKPEGKWKVKEEKFTSLCYAGHLPGYTMSYNHHGLVFTINTLSCKKLVPGKIPRHFITRALLAAENMDEALKIMKDVGCGAADGCSFNITFLKGDNKPGGNNQGEDILFYNIEMAPDYLKKESALNILPVNSGETSLHCNTYLRTSIEEVPLIGLMSSVTRLSTLTAYPAPKTKDDVIKMLGDETKGRYSVYRDCHPEDINRTIAVGIFDCIEKTLSVYSDNPRKSEPTVVLPILLKQEL